MNENLVWVKAKLPESLHTELKIVAAREKHSDGSKKTLEDVIVELLQEGVSKKKAA